MVITKAIIPAGGLGTRFLPATKIMPKEMLPLIDRPAIQYIVDEGARSGIKQFVVITGKHKSVIEDHFDPYPELENVLKSRNKGELLEGLNRLITACNFVYIRQKEPLGLGHAVWSARHIFNKEHVAVFLPDDIIVSATPCMQQLIAIATQEKCNVVAVQEVPIEQVSNYGVISVRRQLSPNLFQVRELVEKPSISQAPSNLAIVGRYVLSPKIFDELEHVQAHSNGEIQLTDAIQAMLLSGEKVFAYKIQGTRYDIGMPMGFLQASIDMALRHSKYSAQMAEYLATLDRDMLVMEGKASALSKIKGATSML